MLIKLEQMQNTE